VWTRHPSGTPGIDSASLRANTRPVERTKNGCYFNATKGTGAELMTTTNAKLKLFADEIGWLSDTGLRKSYSQRQNQKRRTRTANCDP
jgi:hypothetical protein